MNIYVHDAAMWGGTCGCFAQTFCACDACTVERPPRPLHVRLCAYHEAHPETSILRDIDIASGVFRLPSLAELERRFVEETPAQ